MINRLSIASHFFFGAGFTAAIFAAKPYLAFILSRRSDVLSDQIVSYLIQALYSFKDLG